MKYLIILLALLIPIGLWSDAYAFCLTDKCKEEKKAEEEIVEAKPVDCYYSLPFTKTKIYIFRAAPANGVCPEVFQVGYINTVDLEIVVLKDNFDDGMEIFHRPNFKNDRNDYKSNYSNLQKFVSEKWIGLKEIHYLKMEELE